MPQLPVTKGRCQFCLRSGEDVEQLISGDSAFICSDCVKACAALLQKPEPEVARPKRDVYLFERLARHFEPQLPEDLVATTREFPMRQQADLQSALDALFGERVIPDNFVGIHQEYQHETISFSKLLERGRGRLRAAPAQFDEVAIGPDQTVAALKNGLWLRREEVPYAVLLASRLIYGADHSLILEIMAPPGEAGLRVSARIFDALERQLSTGSCYRGRVLSLEPQYEYSGHAGRITVHELEPVTREEVILPEDTLAAVERNVLEFARQRPALRGLGLSTQKGLLFHGSPGTGKTHCIRYLAGRLQDHTTLLITAEGVGALPEYMTLARMLQPALVVVEDADLIARERTSAANACSEVMLNRLLNEMDGLRERADVFFILTTNRPETLEPALAGRPGRIDQAIEFPLPDLTHRRRLIALYARGLQLAPSLIEELAVRTDGASPAFIKELLRRVAQHHLATSDDVVRRETAEAALHEMLFAGGELNVRILGGEVATE